MNNYYCLIPNTNLAFVPIPKNASTYLKATVFYKKFGVWNTSVKHVHQLLGYGEQSPYFINRAKVQEYESKNGQLTKFAVYRDPIERLLSAYKFFCFGEPSLIMTTKIGLFLGMPFELFLERVKTHLSEIPVDLQDNHFKCQFDIYNPNEVDYIVEIENLYTFLKSYISDCYEAGINKTGSKQNIDITSFTNEIKTLYEKDYDQYELLKQDVPSPKLYRV